MNAAKADSNANVKEVVPFLGVTNMERSLAYYVDGLGFTMKPKWVVEGKIRWCWLALNDAAGPALMLQEFLKERVPQGKLGEGHSISFAGTPWPAIGAPAPSAEHEVRSPKLEVTVIEAEEPFVGNAMWVTGLTDPDGYRLFFESPTDTPEETKLSEVKG